MTLKYLKSFFRFALITLSKIVLMESPKSYILEKGKWVSLRKKDSLCRWCGCWFLHVPQKANDQKHDAYNNQRGA
jgi:hypothetical protein